MSGRAWRGVVVASLVTLLPSGARAGSYPSVACGLGDTCVLFGGQSMWCWGRNDAGQLADGTTIDRHFPISAAGGSGSYFMVVGDRNVCISDEGQPACAGTNEFGQIGDGTTIDRHSFTNVSGTLGPLGLLGISPGDSPCLTSWTITVGPGGAFLGEFPNVYCWGSNASGSVGDGTTTDRSLPVLVLPGGFGVVTSGSGGHACAFTGTGTSGTAAPFTLWCWGNNVDDALGVGPGAGAMSTTPVQVPLPDGGGQTYDLAVGVDHNCIVRSDATLWCWGANDRGQLGDGTTTSRDSPVQVVGLTSSSGVSVSPTGEFTCANAIGPSGSGVYCWGRNDRGQLGDGTTADRAVPVLVGGVVTGQHRLATGQNHACAYFFATATRGDSVACWGGNEHGQIGDGTTTDRPTPVFVTFGVSAPPVPALGGGLQAVLGPSLLVASIIVASARRKRGKSIPPRRLDR
jgi:hypothetical protein